MEAIETKYALLEQELIEKRHKSKVQIAEFMEGNVGLKLMDLSKHRLNIEAWFKHSHQVEIIRKYQELREKLKQLLTEDLPALEVQYLASIHTTDTSRDVEVEITSEEDGKISWDKGFTISKPLPKSVTLIKDNHMPSNCRSVCCYKGNTYVGLDDYSVARVDEHYHITISLVRFANFVDAIVVYNDRIYSLVHGNPYMIHVHDLTGNPITQWQHSDNATYGYGSKLTINSDQIIVSDRLNQRLTVYSLNGETIKNVPCSQLGTGAVAIGAAGDNDIIVSNTNARLVFRFNMSTGIVVWTATPIQSPQGVIPYRKNFVCVVSQSTRSVHVLNIKTGEQVSQFTDANITNNTYFDLEVSGQNLIIPKSGTTSLLFYRMSTQPNA
ncbi:uncharacterized protein [Watersipora subatra]|uniref:uncharacterized protein n=1 Tax=Watersipora subatra TaxID=2589382 RepID=UPI00355AE620